MNERLSPDVAVTTPSRPREIGILTTVDEAITSRRSVRGFLPKPVPRAVVEHLLRVASRAPSGTNTQPWCVHVAAGDTLTAIKQDLLAAHDNPEMRAGREYEPYPMKWYEPYLGRRRKVGWDLYGLLGIARGDRQAMHRQHGLNY